MNDKEEILNPNSLNGHEGALLQVINWGEHMFSSYADNGYRALNPTRGDVVMLVATEETDEHFGWIDILHAEKVIRLKLHPKYWMRHFIPWPRGGFVP